jgi:phosphomannomutase
LTLKDGSSVIAHPSGTEPKLKVYYTCVSSALAKAVELRERIADEFSKVIEA